MMIDGVLVCRWCSTNIQLELRVGRLGQLLSCGGGGGGWVVVAGVVMVVAVVVVV